MMPLKAIMDLLKKVDNKEERERLSRGGRGSLRLEGGRGGGEVYKERRVVRRDGKEEELFPGISYGSGYVHVADVDENEDSEESKGVSSPSSSARQRRVRFSLEREE